LFPFLLSSLLPASLLFFLEIPTFNGVHNI
jgi:hypothetical protein